MIKKGTRILCPQCKQVVATLNEDLHYGKKITGATLNPKDQLIDVQLGSAMNTNCCGVPYLVNSDFTFDPRDVA